MQTNSKRRSIRIKSPKQVQFVVSNRPYQGIIFNESKGGVFIETRGPFSQGQEVSMTFVSNYGIQIQRTGEIARVDPKGIGVKFSHPGYAR
jgi:hypothetical protein